MALRAFQCNPSLGGFGSESTGRYHPLSQSSQQTSSKKKKKRGGGAVNNTSATTTASNGTNDTRIQILEGCDDAFAQIIKELVDNGVDACTTSNTTAGDGQNNEKQCNTGSRGGNKGSTSDSCRQDVTQEKRNSLKRVRVAIERYSPPSKDSKFKTKHLHGKESSSALSSTNPDENDIDDNNDDDDEEEQELLRVTISDNGCGMQDIEKCVSAFSTNKNLATSTSAPDQKSSSSSQRTISHTQSKKSKQTQQSNDTNKTNQNETIYAGRYGIGLTLCLLHAQRLVPNSCTSITSATTTSSHWTRARFVVDTELDKVVCVSKEQLSSIRDLVEDVEGEGTMDGIQGGSRKKGEECGTAVSLLLPGGHNAKKAWPRLAEYFARFQLSLGLQCSLQVKAPSLSSVPLFIRPPFEMERRRREQEETRRLRRMKRENRLEQNQKQYQQCNSSNEHEKENHCVNTSNDLGSSSLGLQYKNINDGQHTNMTMSQYSNTKTQEDEDIEWNDGGIFDDNIGLYPLMSQCEDQSKKASAAAVTTSSTSPVSIPKTKSVKLEEEMINQRIKIQKAVSFYLNRTLLLKNIAHSVQSIRRDGHRTSSTLEVSMIVYGHQEHGQHQDGDNCNHDDTHSHDGSDDNDDDERHECDNEVETEEQDKSSSILMEGEEKDECKGKVMLVRMVNRIPMLDGAEASACGIVCGISRKKNVWNSFGLEVSTMDSSSCVQQQCSISTTTTTGRQRNSQAESSPTSSLSSRLFMPSYSLSDSAQVAPFFTKRNTHSLFSADDPDYEDNDIGLHEYGEDEEEEDDDGTVMGPTTISASRRRKKKTKLLPRPVGVRLGNILMVVELNSNPTDLPLPTLSKGRLPLNDKGIDDALEMGMNACLRSLQTTNPSLLLTTSQLKRTERSVRYIPAVSSALSSLVSNCTNLSQKNRMMTKIESWNRSDWESPSGLEEGDNMSQPSLPSTATTSATTPSPMMMMEFNASNDYLQGNATHHHQESGSHHDDDDGDSNLLSDLEENEDSYTMPTTLRKTRPYAVNKRQLQQSIDAIEQRFSHVLTVKEEERKEKAEAELRKLRELASRKKKQKRQRNSSSARGNDGDNVEEEDDEFDDIHDLNMML